MAGNSDGGHRAALENVRRHGADFYARIGAKGGRKGVTGGFASKKVGKDGLTGPQRAKKFGQIGGSNSRRGKSLKTA